MTRVERSALVAYPAEQLFALVADIERYPQFLPWCRAARIDHREGDEVQATLEIDFHGLRQRFSTRNTEEAPRSITLALVSGPFKRLSGLWRFTALGEAACKVELTLEYEFGSLLLSRMVGPVFGRIANTMVDAFVKRAAQVAAQGPDASR
jgi:ribosome-associated toxin RatA of RatAB toxin-antitoxin module